MIRKMFRVIGGFVAFLTYHALILPLVIMLLPFSAYTAFKYRKIELEDLVYAKEVEWVRNLKWPNVYLTIVEKITGWKG